MKHKFKVGDRVHFTTAGEKVFKIVSIDSTQIPYELESIDNLDETFFTIGSNIKLIPTMKNIKDLGEKVAIQCKTQEEWDWVTKELGYKWRGACWCYYKEETLISATENAYCKDAFRDGTYTIVQASDFMPLSPQDEIKKLKARIATLEETLRPKKKIEFVKFINVGLDPFLEDVKRHPNSFAFIERIVCATRDNELDILECWNGDRSLSCIYLGHFNDGIK